MGDNGCTKEPLFLEAMLAYYKLTPTNAIANTIGQLHMQNGDTDKALIWIEKSLVGAGEEERQKAAGTVLMLSKLAYKNESNYSKARSLAYKAAEMGGGSIAADAYTFIGDLYMMSYKQCKGDGPVLMRIAFLAAYDMYVKGGNTDKIASAKAQFPSKEDVFSGPYKEGQTLDIGCWIGGTTTLRTR